MDAGNNNSVVNTYVYGNYIDEVLFSPGVGGNYYYLHDHLYSPAALVDVSGTVIERYEYDAYGKVSIMSANYEPRTTSLHDNAYYFTGRRLDVLDNSSLEVMYYRNRYYDTYAGRFIQHDPLGIDPAGSVMNPFLAKNQYIDSANLYEYVDSNPCRNLDPSGFKTYRDCLATLIERQNKIRKNLGICTTGCIGDCGLVQAKCATLCGILWWHYGGAGGPFSVKACIVVCNGSGAVVGIICEGLCLKIFSMEAKSAQEAYDRCWKEAER